jgi:hypothetical protein
MASEVSTDSPENLDEHRSHEKKFQDKIKTKDIPPLLINGVSVGMDPNSFDRSEIYKQNFEKMGKGKENIKVFEKFFDENYCKTVIEQIVKTAEPIEQPVQWDTDGNPTITRKSYDGAYRGRPNGTLGVLLQKHVPSIKEIMEREYGFPVQNIVAFAARWDKGDSLSLHVDDLGRDDFNHMATLVYLNDDYEGGELEFPTHQLLYKPKAGDLIMFPGNMHYAHEVKTIRSGSRWTLPMWFEFV